jgi:hypothetical protein
VFPSRGRWLSARAFEYELTALLVAGMPAFNSPVWFNVGCERL